MSSIVRLRGSVGEGLELVVALARQVDLGVSVTRHVLARDAHAPDAKHPPALVPRVEPRRLTGLEPPELLLAATVVVAVVRDTQVATTGSIPIAEQHRQRAPARRQGDLRAVGRAATRRTDQSVIGAFARRFAVAVERQVVAEGERGQGGRRALPRRAEADGPTLPARERQRLVGPLEAALTESAEDDSSPNRSTARSVTRSPSMSSGYTPVTAVRSEFGSGTRSNRNEPPSSLRLRYSDDGPSPPARYRSAMPSSSQSNAATPPPTTYG